MANNTKIVGNETLKTYHSDLLTIFARQDGFYESMGVGTANNLYSNRGLEKTDTFIVQKSANGGNIDSGVATFNSIKGKSVAFNQLVKNGNFATKDTWVLYNLSDTTWSVENNVASIVINSMSTSYGQFFQRITPISSHKYLFVASIKASANASVQWRFGSHRNNISLTTSWNTFAFLETRTDTGSDFGLYVVNTITTPITIDIKNVMYFDLTQMFGVGNEPTSVDEFIRMFPKSFYDYNSGTIMSSKSSKYKIVGFNQYDLLNGDSYIRVLNNCNYIIEGDFTKIEYYDYDKSLVGENTSSSFTTPLYCSYVKVIGGNSTTCLYLNNGGAKSGYEDYYSKEYDLPNIELKGIGSVCDEIKPNGTYIQRIGTRAYQEGDESDSNVLTDKTNTLYVLTNEIAVQKPIYHFDEYTKIDEYGIQEFDSEIAQGADFLYQTNLKNYIFDIYERTGGDANKIALVSNYPILYRHTITITIRTRTCVFTIENSKNLIVDSIQDLTTLLGGTEIGVFYRHSDNNYYNKLVIGSIITNCYFVSDDTSVEKLQLSSLTMTISDSVTAINFNAN